MSELNIDVPLAKSEDIVDFGDFQCSEDVQNSNANTNNYNNFTSNHKCSSLSSSSTTAAVTDNHTNDTTMMMDNNFGETFSGSLEDLVNTFDEKITKCFHNYDESVENLAPVQLRTQEEIMNQSEMWWTLTGNFGNILPIDWSKTYARKLHLPTLNMNEPMNGDHQLRTNFNDLIDTTVDEEELAKDLDLHSLILASLQHEPIFTAEQVLEEIDEIMMQGSVTSNTNSDMSVDKSPVNGEGKTKTAINALLYDEKLKTYSTAQLNELFMELERMIQEHSETLINELALRDELEYEKELKNNFISLLLSIQNKRRQHHIDRKRGRGINEPKYLTTVIPYNAGDGPPDVKTLQILIKILRAVNDDSPTVPTLLTDFILKVLCPT